MKTSLCIAAALFALVAPLAVSGELRGRDIVQTIDSGLPHTGGGFMEISNQDWVDYHVEVIPQNATIRFYDANSRRGRRGFLLPSGAKVAIPSPRQVWQLTGDNGRTLSVGVHNKRTTPVRLVPNGDGRLIGMEAIVHDGHRDTGELLMHWDRRGPEGWPREEPPTPYYDNNPYYEDGGYPVPVIGRDPPPYYGNPYYDDTPHRVPVIGQDPPPHRGGPQGGGRPHRGTPYHYEGPPIQIPPKQHMNPLIRR